MQKIPFVFKFQKVIFLFLYSLCILFIFTHGTRDFTNQPITSKNSNLNNGKTDGHFSCTFSFFLRGFTEFFFVSFCSRKFVSLLIGILRSFGVFVLAKSCGLFNKFIHIFYGGLESSLFFLKWIFYTDVVLLMC